MAFLVFRQALFFADNASVSARFDRNPVCAQSLTKEENSHGNYLLRRSAHPSYGADLRLDALALPGLASGPED